MGFGNKGGLGMGGHSRGGAGRSHGPLNSRPSRPMTPPPVRTPLGGAAFGQPTININTRGKGLIGTLTGAAVGVAGAAIVNKMQESTQSKLQAQQAEEEARLRAQEAQYEAEMRQREAEYRVEIERLKVKQEEAKADAMQPTKRYYANCPYCLGVNNGAKECQFCGSSLAYYEDDEDEPVNNAAQGVTNQNPILTNLSNMTPEQMVEYARNPAEYMANHQAQ